MQKFKKVDSLRSDDEEEGMKVHLGLGRARSVFSRGSRVIGSENMAVVQSRGLRVEEPRITLGGWGLLSSAPPPPGVVRIRLPL